MQQNFFSLSRKLVQEPFQHPPLLQSVWGKPWGMRSPVGAIRQVLMHRPGHEVLLLDENSGAIESGPLLLQHIQGCLPKNSPVQSVDLSVLQEQHDHLAAVLKQHGVEVLGLEGTVEHFPEAIFTRDGGMVVPGGIILSRPALHVRHGETPLLASTLSRAGMPILGMIQGKGLAEGGSFTMLDERTAVIGRSERVNADGIHQVRQLLSLQDIELMTVELPASIIHLDEAFVIVDHQKALVNIAVLPFWFLDELQQRGFELLQVHPQDPMLSINVFALSPGQVLCSKSGVRTLELLSRNGVEAIPVDVSEIHKLGGGIHCCILPLMRDYV
ncbi:amidinotransferase [Paenibacillus sp. F411]|uniref:Amidinotransferase family protein n=1 Tax=Paenibacillus algicola TaxID=2565926 RepID=A0A4P8XLJ2_9BACL|nr:MULTISPECIES: arginine deiminase family protein [Paenibacillus]MBO2944418.1 amidinotransferase [Paenibacillus sp. F411]QCT01049.1 amidinotransferase family protein [Paenibacillus algicola]